MTPSSKTSKAAAAPRRAECGEWRTVDGESVDAEGWGKEEEGRKEEREG